MCDYSLHAVKTRDAKVGDKLITHQFPSGLTTGLCDPADMETAVCLRPGTELSFDIPLSTRSGTIFNRKKKYTAGVGVFCQINLDEHNMHHDALEMPNGDRVLINSLEENQNLTVLQLPAQAQPAKPEKVEEQERLESVS